MKPWYHVVLVIDANLYCIVFIRQYIVRTDTDVCLSFKAPFFSRIYYRCKHEIWKIWKTKKIIPHTHVRAGNWRFSELTSRAAACIYATHGALAWLYFIYGCASRRVLRKSEALAAACGRPGLACLPAYLLHANDRSSREPARAAAVLLLIELLYCWWRLDGIDDRARQCQIMPGYCP